MIIWYVRLCARCWGRGKDTVPASVGQATHNDMCWVGREVDSLVSCVLSTKKYAKLWIEGFCGSFANYQVKKINGHL